MKLSDIKGERVMDVIADCVEPVANIAVDPDASRLFKREKLPAGKSVKEFMAEKIKTSLPSLLKTHKKDVITILSTIEGVSYEEYVEKLNFTSLISDCSDLVTDDAFLSLFTSAQSPTGNSTSTSAQESTEAVEA